jgi:ubiquinone/menaquinone biosynthesis C-methylase UbiE
LSVTCLDASAGMLRHARARAQRAGADLSRVVFVHAALPDWRPAEQFDAIATHFFLDCFPPEPLAAVIATLASAASAEARWIVSDFSLPERGWRRWRAGAIHALMYGFFRVAAGLTARRWTNPDPLLEQAGFRLVSRRTSEWGLLQADLWQRAA